MCIRKTTHTNRKNGQKCHTCKLVESIRTERGPRQRPVLNLGRHLSSPEDQWKNLASRIESVITGQQNLFPVSNELERLARTFVRKIIRRHGQRTPVSTEDAQKPDFQTADINSLENEQIRSAGGESVVLETMKELRPDSKFEAPGFNQPFTEAAIGVIAARLLAPASERATHLWLKNNTAPDDLTDTGSEPLSQDRVYRVSDMLPGDKDKTEKHLQNHERHLFNPDEKILLYDLTDTFFEGSGRYDKKARFGKSEEKRGDCPLVTPGLLTDADGFPKKSEVPEGNVSEAGTLQNILSKISATTVNPVIVTDAGIGTQENVRRLADNRYKYVVVSRKRKKEMPDDDKMVKVREDDRRVIRAALRTCDDGETEVCCHSGAREIRERGIKTRFERRFENQLTIARNALYKKGGIKKYDKVPERIGRLKEKYRRVASGYEVCTEKDSQSEYAENMTWSMREIDDTSGYYVLRSNLKKADEKEISDIFNMLPDLEDAFRSVKSELGLRPVHHQSEFRCDGHLFITVLAYHILIYSMRFD